MKQAYVQRYMSINSVLVTPNIFLHEKRAYAVLLKRTQPSILQMCSFFFAPSLFTPYFLMGNISPYVPHLHNHSKSPYLKCFNQKAEKMICNNTIIAQEIVA